MLTNLSIQFVSYQPPIIGDTGLIGAIYVLGTETVAVRATVEKGCLKTEDILDWPVALVQLCNEVLEIAKTERDY